MKRRAVERVVEAGGNYVRVECGQRVTYLRIPMAYEALRLEERFQLIHKDAKEMHDELSDAPTLDQVKPIMQLQAAATGYLIAKLWSDPDWDLDPSGEPQYQQLQTAETFGLGCYHDLLDSGWTQEQIDALGRACQKTLARGATTHLPNRVQEVLDFGEPKTELRTA